MEFVVLNINILCKTDCQEPREFNLFLQTQLRWNQRKSVKTNGLFPSKDELVDVFLEGDGPGPLNSTIY